MKIAFIGSRGIPARYSGFEQFYEQIAVRLSNRGHDVYVYNRSNFIKDYKKEYKGVKIVSLPSIATKHLDTISHTSSKNTISLLDNEIAKPFCVFVAQTISWLVTISENASMVLAICIGRGM